MFIVDAHLDLAYNALKYNRDLRLSLAELRRLEEGLPQPNGRATVTYSTLIEAGIGLVFGTLFVGPADHPLIVADPITSYRNPAEAHRAGQVQLDYYHRLVDEDGRIRLVGNLAQLEEVVASHTDEGRERLLGIVPLMEGADPIREPEELEMWHERGLRMIGPAWDDTRYAAGAWKGGGGLTPVGRRLLEVMAEFNFILDLTHMSEQATLEALDQYDGPIVATHSNSRALVPTQRQLSDLQIRLVTERGGIVGVVPFNIFLLADHRRGEPKERVTLDHVVAHIDHICQVVGNARHVGLGSDFDGGFGSADIPAEMDSAADLPLIGQALKARGYEPADVANILGGNWLRFLRQVWSK
jgi:membrane dipeptidase